jgi:hypothetical protein
MAPELIEPSDEDNPLPLTIASDIYALSVTIWQVSALLLPKGASLTCNPSYSQPKYPSRTSATILQSQGRCSKENALLDPTVASLLVSTTSCGSRWGVAGVPNRTIARHCRPSSMPSWKCS